MRGIAILLGFLLAMPAGAQTIVESDHRDAASVTLYRDRGRGEDPIDPRWPGGYALITETRTITLPAGRAIIRFQGVSEGMLPETAIVTGLPRGVKEKNRDARLLSPAGLVDAYLKRRVTITRTNRATGKVTVGDAIIQAGPGGGVVLTTAEGVEALGCSGLPESLSYPGVPADLSAKPTLSVIADSASAVTVTVQLSYLSQGFDWSANYVASVDEDGKSLNLFAWMTVANGGSQGFVAAQTQAIAGAPNHEGNRLQPKGPEPALHLRCWPMDITSTHDRWGVRRPPREMRKSADSISDITVVSAESLRRRSDRKMSAASPITVLTAGQEELGDLKLYHIPEPVTVAAQSRKQVAMIKRGKVRVDRIYTARFDDFNYDKNAAPRGVELSALVLRTENRGANGLGLPLPAGAVALFEQSGGAPLLIFESQFRDHAIGDEVEFEAGMSSDVRYRMVAQRPAARRRPFSVRVTNARNTPETFEFLIPYELASASETLVDRMGRKAWRVTVPANGEAVLDFAIKSYR